jgi:hypothetical protein
VGVAILIDMFLLEATPAEVRYRAQIGVPVPSGTDKRGRTTFTSEVRVGTFVFRPLTEQLAFDDSADAVFRDRDDHRYRCLRKMLECKRGGSFPAHVVYAA